MQNNKTSLCLETFPVDLGCRERREEIVLWPAATFAELPVEVCEQLAQGLHRLGSGTGVRGRDHRIGPPLERVAVLGRHPQHLGDDEHR
jgi:hypothetical protein